MEVSLITQFDTLIRHWVFGLRSDWLTSLMRGITSLGYAVQITGIIAVITLAFLYWRKYFEATGFLGALLGANLLTEGLKGLVRRARPPLPWLGSATGYSFPSGHSLVAVVLYGFLLYLVVSNMKPSGWRKALISLLTVIPFLIGMSRVYLGVHYPSDVAGGWILALLWLGIWIGAINFARKKWGQKRQPGEDSETETA